MLQFKYMKQYELIIIGGGPAGVAAGVYAARKRVKTLLITVDYGGQSVVSPDVQNWVGIVSLPGPELAKRLEEHVKAYAEDVLECKEGTKVTRVTQRLVANKPGGPLFEVETDKGEVYEAKALIVASGASRRKLKIKGAEEFDNKGIVYCASCDAPLFKDKDVVVIGGGNAGLESAEQLIAYAKSIRILELGPEFRGDRITQKRIFADEKITPITDAETIEVKGDKFVTGLVYKDKKTGKTHELAVQGVFVEIGSVPNTSFVKDLCELNKYGEIIIDHKTARTNIEGIWAAGDATDEPYKQNNISMGDAVKALEDLYIWLQKRK